MPKVMTIGSIKDALPAGSYQGQVGKLRSLGAVSPARGSRAKKKPQEVWAEGMRFKAKAKLTPAQSERMWQNIQAQIDRESGRTMAGLGSACKEYGYTTRTRTVWKCPSKKKRSRAQRTAQCKKVEVKTRELVCLTYDPRLTQSGRTSEHKRAAFCKSPRRKLKKSR